MDPLVWGHTVEGLISVGNRKGSPEWVARMRSVGLDVTTPVATAYPRDRWRDFIFNSADVLFDGTPEERLWKLGSAFIEEYEHTFLGRAVAAVVRLIGPRRALERMTKSLRSGNNYSDTRVQFTGATKAEFWLNDTLGAPSYICGALTAVLKISGAKQIDVKTVTVEGVSATFSIEWAE